MLKRCLWARKLPSTWEEGFLRMLRNRPNEVALRHLKGDKLEQKSKNKKRYNHQVITSRGGLTKTEAHACTWCRSRWWRSWCARCREPPGSGSTSTNWLGFTEWATRIHDEVVSCPQGKSDPNYFCKMWAVGWELTSANWQGFTGTLWSKEWQCKIDRHQQSPKLWWVSTK